MGDIRSCGMECKGTAIGIVSKVRTPIKLIIIH
jgi:hypothetical protein